MVWSLTDAAMTVPTAVEVALADPAPVDTAGRAGHVHTTPILLRGHTAAGIGTALGFPEAPKVIACRYEQE